MERERWTGGLTAKLGQEDAAVALLQLDLQRVRITETFAASLLMEAREGCPLGEEVGVGAPQVLECLLQRMDGSLGEPRRLRAVAPRGEELAERGVAQVLLTPPTPLFLEREGLVVDEAAGTGEAAHEPALCNRWHQLVLEGLPAFHGQGSRRSEPSRPHPKITRNTPESHPFEAS